MCFKAIAVPIAHAIRASRKEMPVSIQLHRFQGEAFGAGGLISAWLAIVLVSAAPVGYGFATAIPDMSLALLVAFKMYRYLDGWEGICS
jgi:hypothetical protein